MAKGETSVKRKMKRIFQMEEKRIFHLSFKIYHWTFAAISDGRTRRFSYRRRTVKGPATDNARSLFKITNLKSQMPNLKFPISNVKF